MALGYGTHTLPVKAEVRRAIGKEEGDTVTVRLDERLGSRDGSGPGGRPHLQDLSERPTS
ncbi:hypothetical protein AQJ91_43540 [Streptomyces dysideae]|uniref:Uncharacterized protein n=1 Tax=Streptomyces dysideae TaxID=909626 RepID=A0A101UQP9_9ACTN|nr:hypothetical protein AQJ91_43540 [Streptomyces dysideae]